MKGTPQFVMCGNSQRALEALRRAGAPVTAVDILPDPRIRAGAVGALGLADDPAGLRAAASWSAAPTSSRSSRPGELERTLRREARRPDYGTTEER